ncbi:DNA repair protein XRCC2-like [Haliotis rufescens]|uniref:DNA repair protein XRCC2-like n=1 Tax=Haliotis rufescens TaxID=6454 RepID=UPI001EB064C7|nr:DNA repair protein XRCC2-like [Haliotis rufescens]
MWARQKSMSKSESGAQLLARLGSRPSLEKVEPKLFPNGLSPGEVVELFGAEGTGKSEVLLHCIAKCILPPEWLTFDLGGLGTKVIFIDTDYKFSILRLVILLEKKITDIVNTEVDETKPSSDEIEVFITKCLKRLYLVRCNSSHQLLCTLHSLETNIAADSDFAGIMIDSISAFYWIDRCNHGDGGSAHEKNMNKIVDILQTIAKKYNLVVMATKAAVFKAKLRDFDKGDNASPFGESKHKGDNSNFSEYLGKVWNKFVGKWLMLEKDVTGGKSIFTSRQKMSGHSVCFTISESGLQFE